MKTSLLITLIFLSTGIIAKEKTLQDFSKEMMCNTIAPAMCMSVDEDSEDYESYGCGEIDIFSGENAGSTPMGRYDDCLEDAKKKYQAYLNGEGDKNSKPQKCEVVTESHVICNGIRYSRD